MREISRRRLLGEAGATAAALGLAGALPAAATRAAPGSRVAVLGGGMAGLAAAHELVERGFKVTVYERKALGGKARSIPVAGTAAGGRRALPGEHGFRFFPGFYHHVPDSMRRTPFPGNANGVWDNLVDATETKSPRTERPRRTARCSASPRPRARRSTPEGDAARCSPTRSAARACRRRRGRVLRQPADGVLHELRRAPLRPVGARAAGGTSSAPRASPRSTRRSSPRGLTRALVAAKETRGQHAHDRQHGRGVRR